MIGYASNGRSYGYCNDKKYYANVIEAGQMFLDGLRSKGCNIGKDVKFHGPGEESLENGYPEGNYFFRRETLGLPKKGQQSFEEDCKQLEEILDWPKATPIDGWTPFTIMSRSCWRVPKGKIRGLCGFTDTGLVFISFKDVGTIVPLSEQY